MKYLPFVPALEASTLDGRPIVTEQGHLRISHVEFLLGHPALQGFPGRLADPAFAQGLDGGDFVELAVSARKSIRDQAGTAEERGYWAFEDEHAKRIVAATLKPAQPYPGQIAHNFAPFIKAARALRDEPPVEAVKAAAE